MKKTTLAIILLTLLSSGSVMASTSNVNLEDLLGKNIQSTKEKEMNSKLSSVSELRKQALSDVAASFGASAGLTKRMIEIKSDLDKWGIPLDKAFNFEKMRIAQGVLPPVISEGRANYAQHSDFEVRVSDVAFKKESSERFVSVYPTWRDYLQFPTTSFEMPDKSLLPQNEAEVIIWDEWVKSGWAVGYKQAQDIFDNALSRLKRDYLGMIKYKILLAQGVVSSPVVARANMGVTGGGNEMLINDQIFRITDQSSLNANRGDWKNYMPVTSIEK